MEGVVLMFLNDFWRDVWTVSGVAGTVATLLALGFTVVQVYRTATAVAAARRAWERAESRHRAELARSAAADAHRLLREATICVEAGQWTAAAMRMSDVADRVAALRGADPAGTGVTADAVRRDRTDLIAAARHWASDFNGLAAGERVWTATLRRKWRDALARLSAGVDADYRPIDTDGPDEEKP